MHDHCDACEIPPDAFLISVRTPRIEVIVRGAHDHGIYPVAQMGLDLDFFYSP
jgi:hypothetical protein